MSVEVFWWGPMGTLIWRPKFMLVSNLGASTQWKFCSSNMKGQARRSNFQYVFWVKSFFRRTSLIKSKLFPVCHQACSLQPKVKTIDPSTQICSLSLCHSVLWLFSSFLAPEDTPFLILSLNMYFKNIFNIKILTYFSSSSFDSGVEEAIHVNWFCHLKEKQASNLTLKLSYHLHTKFTEHIHTFYKD